MFWRWSLLLHTREVLCLTCWFMMQEVSGCSQDSDSMWITLFWLCCAIHKTWATTFPMFPCFNLVPLDSRFFDFRGAVLIYTSRNSALESFWRLFQLWGWRTREVCLELKVRVTSWLCKSRVLVRCPPQRGESKLLCHKPMLCVSCTKQDLIEWDAYQLHGEKRKSSVSSRRESSQQL